MINIFIAAYIIGYIVFFTSGEEGSVAWENAFFIWQQFGYGSIFAWGSLYTYGKGSVRSKAKWMLIFSCLMGVWQIATVVLGLNVNNEWAVMAAFVLIVIVAIILCIKEDEAADKWLRKHIKLYD